MQFVKNINALSNNRNHAHSYMGEKNVLALLQMIVS